MEFPGHKNLTNLEFDSLRSLGAKMSIHWIIFPLEKKNIQWKNYPVEKNPVEENGPLGVPCSILYSAGPITWDDQTG